MNIFVTSPFAHECAKELDDLRLNKMILETGQMLSVAYRHWAPQYGLSPEFDGIYKVTHQNHPCNIWLRDQKINFLWCIRLFDSLAAEKRLRLGNNHLSHIKLSPNFWHIAGLIAKDLNLDEAMREVKFNFNCSNVAIPTGNVFDDYKLCLANKWNQDKKYPRWTGRGKPSWLLGEYGSYRVRGL